MSRAVPGEGTEAEAAFQRHRPSAVKAPGVTTQRQSHGGGKRSTGGAAAGAGGRESGVCACESSQADRDQHGVSHPAGEAVRTLGREAVAGGSAPTCLLLTRLMSKTFRTPDAPCTAAPRCGLRPRHTVARPPPQGTGTRRRRNGWGHAPPPGPLAASPAPAPGPWRSWCVFWLTAVLSPECHTSGSTRGLGFRGRFLHAARST